MVISKADIEDADFVDAAELISDGLVSVYLTLNVVSTTSNDIIIVNTGEDGEGIIGRDHPVEVGDLVAISGTTGGATDGADGLYTVATIVNATTFTVIENIPASTGGVANFRYKPGALKVGFNPTSLVHVTSHEVQNAIKELDASIVTVITSSAYIAHFDIVLNPPVSDIYSTVINLPFPPLKVFGFSCRELSVQVQSGMVYDVQVLKLNVDGFDYRFFVRENEYWPGPGPVTVRVSYLWSQV